MGGGGVEWKVARDCIYCRVEVQKHIDAKILIVNIIHPVLSVAFIRARLGRLMLFFVFLS